MKAAAERKIVSTERLANDFEGYVPALTHLFANTYRSTKVVPELHYTGVRMYPFRIYMPTRPGPVLAGQDKRSTLDEIRVHA